MTTTWLDFEPIDVFIPRGNRLFGGSVHGQVTMPPWPSLFTGAIASRALADAGLLGEVAKQPDEVEKILAERLGYEFGLSGLALEWKQGPLLPLPADLLVLTADDNGQRRLCRLSPRILTGGGFGVGLSSPLPRNPILEDVSRKKPLTGFWITVQGLMEHLAGRLPPENVLVETENIWKTDPRLGIALDRDSRTAAEGDIYTTDTVALAPGVRFLAGFTGNNIPQDGLVRLGGDGRGAHISPTSETVAASLAQLGKPQSGWSGFRMILATPGIFPEGWLPPGVDPKTRRLAFEGLVAGLEAAVVSRPEVISGWDLAGQTPKPARQVATTGSVYWFKVLEGDTAALASLWESGLLSSDANNFEIRSRRREGFGRVWFGAWHC